MYNFEKYPFERLNELLEDIKPNSDYELSSLTIGEPQFSTPDFIQEELKNSTELLNKYPKSSGENFLKDAMRNFISKRFNVEKFVILEKPSTTFNDIGGLQKQIQELKEVVELPLIKPHLFEKIEFKPRFKIHITGCIICTRLGKNNKAVRVKGTFIFVCKRDSSKTIVFRAFVYKITFRVFRKLTIPFGLNIHIFEVKMICFTAS